MRRILVFALAALCLAGCKRDGPVDLSVAGTTWKCRYLTTEYTMEFGNDNTVTVSQIDYEKNRKYWDDAHGTYTQSGGDIVFQLWMPEIIRQERYLRGRTTDGIVMRVTIQDYLDGEEFLGEHELTYQIKTR